MKSFLLDPAGKDYIWGGTRLKTDFGKNLPQEPLAETWECSVHPDGPSRAASGPLAGHTLPDILSLHPEFLGTSPSVSGKEGMHILVKLIDARDNLSVQVHPDDGYAAREENGQEGKTEMWYVLDAEPGAKLVYGLHHDTSARELKESLARGNFESYLHQVPVRKNDVFFIPAGTIHAIGRGVLLAEIQQNSNLTYRLYDYGRCGKDGKPRPLHIDKALSVARLEAAPDPRQPMRSLRYRPGYAEEILSKCPYFQVKRCLLDAASIDMVDLPDAYRVLLCIDGSGCLSEGDGSLSFTKGQTLFIPATAGPLRLSGRAEFLLIRG